MEAMAGSYLPLLELLEQGAPLTLSLTPVLCDQLEAPGIGERFSAFVEGVRDDTDGEDAMGLRAWPMSSSHERSSARGSDDERALVILADHEGDLLGALAPYAQWTSSATCTPCFLCWPATRTPRPGPRLTPECLAQTAVGGDWREGFSASGVRLCAPWLLPSLREAGVASVCVELTNALGLGAPDQLRPQLTDEGVTVVPIDALRSRWCGSEDGYPAAGAYRGDYHHHTIHHHNPWNNAGEPNYRRGARDSGPRAGGRLRRAGESAAANGRRAGRRFRVCPGHRAAGALVV